MGNNKLNSTQLKCSLGFKGAIIWNNLPLNIRNITSYKRFKNKVKEYVI